MQELMGEAILLLFVHTAHTAKSEIAFQVLHKLSRTLALGQSLIWLSFFELWCGSWHGLTSRSWNGMSWFRVVEQTSMWKSWKAISNWAVFLATLYQDWWNPCIVLQGPTPRLQHWLWLSGIY
jgi:hypothetical protein